MMEIFTIGGGEYLVTIFNAVSAWTGGGGFRALLRVVMVIGLIYTLLIVAFSLDWRVWFNWFVGATLIYGVLIVPTTPVRITDRLNPSLAPATVANVPVGLAMVASVSSQAGDWLTRTAETVFVMPNALQMSTNGMIYGARLWDRTRDFQIRDPRINANLAEYFRQCLFYDILLGHSSFDTIANSHNLLADMGPGSPARGMKFMPADGRPTIITCQDGYRQLQAGMTAYTELGLEQEGRKLFPGLTPALAKAKLVSDLPVIAGQFHGSSQTAQQVFQQRALVSAFLEARANLGAADGDTFAMLRAEEQARNTYSSIAQQAMTWVPLLNIVLTVVFYAMFPVIFPLFLVPRTGIVALKGYFTGFCYLAAWGPLYVVLHMFIMDRASVSQNATAPGGITMAGMAGIDAVNADTATIAGFLMMSIPFLAAGMARGAMAVSSQATSMLAPAQAAAEAAAVERTTGNYAYGNENFMNLSGFNRQSEQWHAAPLFTGGATVLSAVNANGTTTRTMADGANVFDTAPGLSRLAFGASLSQFANAERQQTLSALETARNTLSQERSRALAVLERTSSRETSGVRMSRGSESSAGYRSSESLQRFDNQSLDARDTVSESDRVVHSEGAQQSNLDRLETSRGGSAGISGAFGGARGRAGSSVGRGTVGVNGGVQASISGSQVRSDTVSRGNDRTQSQGFDSSTSDNRSNGSNATQDSGSYAQSGHFQRSEGYSENAYAREHALEAVRRIDQRMAQIEELSTALSESTSTREGYGANISFDMSQIVASRYHEKAAELGITAPSLARTDYSPQEQAAHELVARAIIADYFDQHTAPFNDLIPEKGTLTGHVSGPGSFSEADLRANAPRRSSAGLRNVAGESSGGAIAARLADGETSLKERYDANGSRFGERRRDFEDGRTDPGGENERFNERFYDRDQR